MIRFDYLSDERMLNREDKRHDSNFWSASSENGMVASAHYKATEAGVEILENGGNAFDAAAAVSLALGVVEPAGSGLGGMTMMVAFHASQNRAFAIEGPCRAPMNATPELVAAAPRKSGYRAVAVPSNPAVLQYVIESYGTMSVEQICRPAIRLAEEGIPVTPFSHHHTMGYLGSIKNGNAQRFLLGPDGEPIPAGSLVKQPVLARTLVRLADAGLEDFYRGDIGREIAEDMRKNGGFIREEDLAGFRLPGETEVVRGMYSGMEVCSLPPPGDGTTLIQMLQLLDRLKPPLFSPDSPEAAVLLARIIQQARKDRRRYRYDSKDCSGISVDRTSSEYADLVSDQLYTRGSAPGETSHFCIMDHTGNVVSVTQSIERSFGAKIASDRLGFLYNGYMKAFKIENRKHPHYLRPGAAARSNAAPTILFRKGRPYAAVGSTGSERMVSGIFQTLVRLEYQSPFKAVQSPRLHCTPEGEVLIEAERYPPGTLDALVDSGFTVRPLDAWSFSTGGLQLTTYDGMYFHGVGEPRRDGAAAGPDNR